MIHKKCDIANLTLGFSFKQNNDDKRNKSHISFICFPNVVFQSPRCVNRAANNFPAAAGQIVRSNLFFLGHIPFLAGQTLIIITLDL